MNAPFDKRANNFDFLRLFFAILVIYCHCYPIGLGGEAQDPMFRLTKGQVNAGTIAVDSFFIISGFLITASFERTASLFSYFKKRTYRIYPAFIVAMLIEAFFVLPLSGGAFEKRTGLHIALDFVVQTLALREFHYVHAFSTNVFPGYMNGSTWTVVYEFLCYIGIAVLGLSGILRSKRILCGLIVLLLPISALFAHFHLTMPGHHLARFTPLYLAGVSFYRFRDRLQLRSLWILSATILLVIASQFPPLWTIVFPLAGSYLILVVAFHPTLPFQRVGKYGDFSYGTYLYAFPVQQLIVHYLGGPLNPITLFAIATPVTLITAVGSWYGIERWFLRQSHKSAERAAHVVHGSAG